MAVLLCAAILLAELAGGMIPMIAQAAATAAEAPDFDQSVLGGLVYDHGTVSAWLEYDCGNGLMTGAFPELLRHDVPEHRLHRRVSGQRIWDRR